MDQIQKVSIIGAGALGAVYASLLYQMDRECVSFIASGDRYERLKKSGVVVNDRHYPIPAVNANESPQPADLVMVAVKHHQLDEAVREMKKSVGKGTIILSVMNGIDSEERIGAVYGMDKVLYGMVLGIDALRDGNRVHYTTQGKIVFGEADGTMSSKVERLRALFARAGIFYDVPADIMAAMWFKFMINVGINQASAVLRAPYEAFQDSEDARRLMHAAMLEVVAIAGKKGIKLSGEDVARFDPVLMSLNPKGKTSMLQDVEARRKTEVEMLAGKVIELGEACGIETPVNRQLFSEIRKIEQSWK